MLNREIGQVIHERSQEPSVEDVIDTPVGDVAAWGGTEEDFGTGYAWVCGHCLDALYVRCIWMKG
jgi:hypothetical protein